MKQTHYSSHKGPDRRHGKSGRLRKTSPLLGFDPWILQPVASCYTDYATPAQNSIPRRNRNLENVKYNVYATRVIYNWIFRSTEDSINKEDV